MTNIPNIFSKENLYYTAASIRAGLVTTPFLALPSKAIGMVSFAGSATSIGHAYLGEEPTQKERAVAMIDVLAASFFSAALYLNTFFSAVFSAKDLFIALASNLAGQAVMSQLVQTILFAPFRSIETLLNLNNDQLLILYKTYEADSAAFKKLSPLMQQLFYYQGFLINMKLSNLPVLPSEEEIAALSYEEVMSLYGLKDFVFTENSPGMQKLLLRFFNCNLKYHKAFDTFLTKLPLLMPKNTRQIERWSPEHQAWYKAFFKENPDAQSELSQNLQRTLCASLPVP